MNKPNPQVEEENRPILPDQENVNSFSSTSELSELTLGRASSLGRTSTGSSTNNDIKGIKEDPSCTFLQQLIKLFFNRLFRKEDVMVYV